MTELINELQEMKKTEIFNIIANTQPSSELEKVEKFTVKYMVTEQIQLEGVSETREVEKATLICEVNGELVGYHSTSLTLNAQLKKAITFFGEEISTQGFTLAMVKKDTRSQYELRTIA